jgi:hypothetical protein
MAHGKFKVCGKGGYATAARQGIADKGDAKRLRLEIVSVLAFRLVCDGHDRGVALRH